MTGESLAAFFIRVDDRIVYLGRLVRFIHINSVGQKLKLIRE